MPIALEMKQRPPQPIAATTGCPPTARQHPPRARQDLHDSLHVADGHDFVASSSARRGDIDDIALGFADERARNRRGHRQQPLLDIGLIIADQLIDHFVAAVLIFQLER